MGNSAPDRLIVPHRQRGDLALVPLSFEHSMGMFSLWSDPEVCRHAGPCVDLHGEPIPTPVEHASDSDRLIGFWLARAARGDGFRWAVLHDGDFIGAVGFNALGECFEYAYHFRSSHWGRGFAFLASQIAIEWAFAQGAEAIDAYILWDNDRSIALAERLGFQLIDGVGDRPPRYRRKRATETGERTFS